MDFKPTLSIDVSCLNDPRADLTTLDAEVLKIAKCNRNFILEEADFYLKRKCFSTLKQKSNGRDPKEIFLQYRTDLIREMTFRQAQPLKEKWPMLDLEALSYVVAQSSVGILDISSLLDKMVKAALKQQPSPYSFEAEKLVLFCLTWLGISSLDQSHKMWTSAGNIPLLPGNEMGDFIGNSLKRLEDGEVKIGIDFTLNAVTTLATYNPENNFIGYSPLYFFNPLPGKYQTLSEDSVRFIPSNTPVKEQFRLPIEAMYATIAHEMYHAEQDFSERAQSLIDSEIEAELLEMKIHLMLFGFETPLGKAKELDLDVNSLDAFEAPLPAPSPDDLLLAYLANEKNRETAGYKDLGLAIAKRELMTGQIDEEERSRFKNAYALFRMNSMLRVLFSATHAKYSRLFEESSSGHFKEKIKKEFGDWPAELPAWQISNETVDGEDFTDQIVSLVERLFYIRYVYSEEEAAKIFESEFIPLLEEDIFQAYEALK